MLVNTFIILSTLVGCGEDTPLGNAPIYEEEIEDTASTSSNNYQPGPDPFEEGEQRMGIGDSYEGASTDSVTIDDMKVFFYIYEDTFVLNQAFDEVIEGIFSYKIVSKGRGWWGGGIHSNATVDIS